jgi:hypothetical protein
MVYSIIQLKDADKTSGSVVGGFTDVVFPATDLCCHSLHLLR